MGCDFLDGEAVKPFASTECWPPSGWAIPRLRELSAEICVALPFPALPAERDPDDAPRQNTRDRQTRADVVMAIRLRKQQELDTEKQGVGWHRFRRSYSQRATRPQERRAHPIGRRKAAAAR